MGIVHRNHQNLYFTASIKNVLGKKTKKIKKNAKQAKQMRDFHLKRPQVDT